MTSAGEAPDACETLTPAYDVGDCDGMIGGAALIADPSRTNRAPVREGDLCRARPIRTRTADPR